MRRKGEKRVVQYLDQWDGRHPVAQAINTGSYWFDAWQGQKCTPNHLLAKRTGLAQARLLALSAGDDVSRAELDALARAWAVSAGDLAKSINTACKIVE